MNISFSSSLLYLSTNMNYLEASSPVLHDKSRPSDLKFCFFSLAFFYYSPIITSVCSHSSFFILVVKSVIFLPLANFVPLCFGSHSFQPYHLHVSRIFSLLLSIMLIFMCHILYTIFYLRQK